GFPVVHPERGGQEVESREVNVAPLGLPGSLRIPRNASALVIFAHGSGSSRLSPRNTTVARALNGHGIATLLFDLLTPEEESANARAKVFDIPLLAARLESAVAWIDRESVLPNIPIGLFGASTGAAAALVTAARLGKRIGAVVSRGGRPDMADEALPQVLAPTLLIVGGADYGVIELNERAYAKLTCEKTLEIVPGATHLFPEPGALNQVIALAGNWFARWLVERTRTNV
ncbi:MAG: dienelactone hydrolase family protein, partial [Rhizomicrobium sp.]